MNKIKFKHVDHLYYNKYTHLLQLEHPLINYNRTQYFFRSLKIQNRLVHNANLTHAVDTIGKGLDDGRTMINWRGDLFKSTTTERYGGNLAVTREHFEEFKRMIWMIYNNRSRYDIQHIRMEHRSISFFGNDALLQEDMIREFPNMVKAVGRPRDTVHEQALVTAQEERTVLRKVLIRNKLKDNKYAFSVELKNMIDLQRSNPALLEMMRDMWQQNTVLPNPALQLWMNGTVINHWKYCKLWLEDDSSLGMLILALGTQYIRHIEEYRLLE